MEWEYRIRKLQQIWYTINLLKSTVSPILFMLPIGMSDWILLQDTK